MTINFKSIQKATRIYFCADYCSEFDDHGYRGIYRLSTVLISNNFIYKHCSCVYLQEMLPIQYKLKYMMSDISMS